MITCGSKSWTPETSTSFREVGAGCSDLNGEHASLSYPGLEPVETRCGMLILLKLRIDVLMRAAR